MILRTAEKAEIPRTKIDEEPFISGLDWAHTCGLGCGEMHQKLQATST